jgi:hemolysin activation/secretion protein
MKKFLILTFLFNLLISFITHADNASITQASQSIYGNNLDNDKSSKFLLKSVKINNHPTSSEYQNSYINYISKTVDQQKIQTIINNINRILQNQGKLLSFAYVSSISPDTGSLNIEIVEGKIRNVKIISNFKVDQNELFKEYVDNILSSQPIYNVELQKNIQLISRIPGYEVEYKLEEINDPQAEIYEVADLILTINKRNANVNLIANNEGVSELGKYQFSAFGRLYNSFNSNEKISLYSGTTNKPDKLKIFVLGVSKPINSEGTSINLSGSYIKDDPNITTPSSDNKNKTYKLEGALNHYFLLTNKYILEGSIGVEHSKDQNYIANTRISTMTYNDIFLGGNIEFSDFINGKNIISPYFYQSIPGMTKINRFNSSAQLLDRNYKFVTLDMYRTQNISKDFSIFTQILTQYSNNNLPIDQTFFIGGLTGGRAYKLGTASSNKGIDFAAEFRYTKDLDNQAVSEVEPYLFYDVVKFSKSYALTNVSTLQSAGAGIRAKLKYDFYGNFETGVPFTRYLTVGGIRQHNPTRYSFILSKAFSF